MSARRLAVAATCLGVVAVTSVTSVARAEPIAPLVQATEGKPVASRAMTAGFGLDGALAATVGAATGIASAGERLSLAGWADVTWATGAVDLGDMRYRIGARIDAVRAGPFRLRATLAPVLRTSETTGFSAIALGTELRVAPGLHTERWSAELELGVEQQWLTHVSPSDSYRANIYSDARTGWYGTTARTLRAGLGAGVRFAPVEIALRSGVERTASLDFLPGVYGALAVGWFF